MTAASGRYSEYVGRTRTAFDRVSTHIVERLAATLDISTPADDRLPPLWHWLLFQEWAPAHALSEDGHPQRGTFLPADPTLPRRMWGAGRVTFHRLLRGGETVKRTSSVLRVSEKQGTTGRILLVTVRHEVNGDDGLAISEEQHILYLGAQATAVKSAPPAVPAPASAFTRPFVPDPVMLFRFSALTGNSHRIHYDERYARSVERYPALVVHGPLQAICLADLLRRHEPDAQLARFEFRSQRAALLGQALVLEGWCDDAATTSVHLRSREGGSVCMQAQATLGQLDT